MAQVFICYRRDDTAGYAGRLRELLVRKLGAENVFMDLWSLGPGADFISAIEDTVGSADVLLALIGKHWLELRDTAGNRRLEDSQDAVRLEIATALRRGVRILPLLLEGATMPAANALPPDLAPLSRIQALTLGNEHWEDESRRLLKAVTLPRFSRLRLIFWPAFAALGLALVVLIPLYLLQPREAPELRAGRRSETAAVKAEVPVVGILPFENRSGDAATDRLGSAFAQLLRDVLMNSNDLQVALPYRMAVLNSGQDESALKRMATAAAIDYLLTGRFEPEGPSLRLVVKLMAVGKNVGEKTWTLYGPPKMLLQKAQEIVAQARRGMGLPPLERVGVLAADFHTENAEAYQAYVAGLKALTEYRYEAAELSFRAALQEEPSFAIARYRLAQILAVTGKTQEALAQIRQAERESQNLSPRERGYIKAAALAYSRDNKRALEAYRELVESFPFDVEAHQLRAQVLMDVESYDDALKELNVILTLDSGLYTTWNFLGDVSLKMGKPEEAVKYLLQSVKLNPEHADTHQTLGDAYRSLKNFDKAAKEYQEALRINPAFSDAAVQLAILRAFQGRRQEAEQLLEPVVSDQEASPRSRIDAAFELSYLLMAKGRFSAAADILAHLQPELEKEIVRESMALSVRGLCAMELGDMAKADRLIRSSIQRAPSRTTTRYLFARGVLELRLSAFQKASLTAGEIRKQALPAADPDRTENKAADYLEGLALLGLGETPRAIQLLQAAISTGGYEYRIYRLGLARAYLASGQLDMASQLAKQAAEILPLGEPRLDLEVERARSLLTLAEIERARGQRADAAAKAREFLRLWQGADPGLADFAQAQRIATAAGE